MDRQRIVTESVDEKIVSEYRLKSNEVIVADYILNELRARVAYLERQREEFRKDFARLKRYDDLLTKEMLPGFKDWHENSREEWPEMAAWVISNLRKRLEEAEAQP